MSTRSLLDLLVGHPACELLADDVVEWREIAALRDVVGRADAAVTAAMAIALEVGILTGQPGLYAGLTDAGPVTEI